MRQRERQQLPMSLLRFYPRRQFKSYNRCCMDQRCPPECWSWLCMLESGDCIRCCKSFHRCHRLDSWSGRRSSPCCRHMSVGSFHSRHRFDPMDNWCRNRSDLHVRKDLIENGLIIWFSINSRMINYKCVCIAWAKYVGPYTFMTRFKTPLQWIGLLTNMPQN